MYINVKYSKLPIDRGGGAAVLSGLIRACHLLGLEIFLILSRYFFLKLRLSHYAGTGTILMLNISNFPSIGDVVQMFSVV